MSDDGVTGDGLSDSKLGAAKNAAFGAATNAINAIKSKPLPGAIGAGVLTGLVALLWPSKKVEKEVGGEIVTKKKTGFIKGAIVTAGAILTIGLGIQAQNPDRIKNWADYVKNRVSPAAGAAPSV